MNDCAVPLRLLLKERTGEVHQALHRLPAFARLARSAISRQDYSRLLQRMESFHAAADPLLAAAGASFAGATGEVADHARAPLLAGDLHHPEVHQ